MGKGSCLYDGPGASSTDPKLASFDSMMFFKGLVTSRPANVNIATTARDRRNRNSAVKFWRKL
jgi:hypothetical protein